MTPVAGRSASTVRLRRLLSGPGAAPDDPVTAPGAQRGPGPSQDRCELCAEPLPGEHRHLADLAVRELLCVCRACSVLFDHGAAGGGHYRLVPDRRRYVADFDLDDDRWQGLGVPVGLAFFFRDSSAGRVVGFYPSPAGAVEAELDLSVWDDVERRNPVLGDLQTDVEALLVRRAADERQHWLAPIDRCYALVALVRAHWVGFTGGDTVWGEIDTFLRGLGHGADLVGRDGTRLGRLPAARTSTVRRLEEAPGR